MIKVIFKIKFAMMILIDEMIELIMYLISNSASILTRKFEFTDPDKFIFI